MHLHSSISFGSGQVYATGPDGQSRQVGFLKDVSLDLSAERKAFKGGADVTLVSVISEKKLTGKAGTATFDGAMMAQAFGATSTVGRRVPYQETTVPVAGSVSVSHASTFAGDLGVRDESGSPLALVVSGSPKTGEYKVAAGVYTFAAEQVGPVSIAYEATDVDGRTYTVRAGQPKAAPTFRLVLSEPSVSGVPNTITLPAVVFAKLGLSFKAEDYSEASLDFEAQADAFGDLVQWTA